MQDTSLYRYMKIGIVHFKAFPEIVRGDGPVVETLKKLVEDDFWTAVEVGWIRDDKVRQEVAALLAVSHMEVAYATQPRVFTNGLDLSALDPKERRRGIEGVKKGIIEAANFGATSIRVLSGKDPGDEKREDAKKAFTESLAELCEFAREYGDAKLYMKIFDRDVDKKALIGHFKDAADVAAAVSPNYDNFGVLVDMSHFPLLDESPEEALPLVEKFPLQFHFGNCIMRDKRHPLYGDLQPRFGIPGGEQDTADLTAFFRLLLEKKLLSPEKRPIVSAEVRPLLPEEYSEAIIANTKRVIKEAWALV